MNRIIKLTKGRSKDHLHYLRVLVDDGGCSGFQYNFKMIDDTELESESDYLFTSNNISVIVDSITMDFINKSTVDYKQEMIRSSFEINSNPLAENGCSCGTSFAPRMD